MNDGVQVHWDKPNEFNLRRRARKDEWSKRVRQPERIRDLDGRDGGKGASSCEDAGAWKIMYSKQAQLVLCENPSNILPESGGRYI